MMGPRTGGGCGQGRANAGAHPTQSDHPPAPTAAHPSITPLCCTQSLCAPPTSLHPPARQVHQVQAALQHGGGGLVPARDVQHKDCGGAVGGRGAGGQRQGMDERLMGRRACGGVAAAARLQQREAASAARSRPPTRPHSLSQPPAHPSASARRRRSWRWPPPRAPPPPCASPPRRPPRSRCPRARRPAPPCARRWAGAGWRCSLVGGGWGREAGAEGESTRGLAFESARLSATRAARWPPSLRPRLAPSLPALPSQPPTPQHPLRPPTLDLASLAPPRHRVGEQVSQLLVVDLFVGRQGAGVGVAGREGGEARSAGSAAPPRWHQGPPCWLLCPPPSPAAGCAHRPAPPSPITLCPQPPRTHHSPPGAVPR